MPKNDILFESGALKPYVLTDVCDRSSQRDVALESVHLAEQGGYETAFAAADRADNSSHGAHLDGNVNASEGRMTLLAVPCERPGLYRNRYISLLWFAVDIRGIHGIGLELFRGEIRNQPLG